MSQTPIVNILQTSPVPVTAMSTHNVPQTGLLDYVSLRIVEGSPCVGKLTSRPEGAYVTFSQTVPIKFPLGVKVCIGQNTFAIGSEKATKPTNVVVMPRKTLYTVADDSVGIPHKLPKDMEFELLPGSTVLLYKGTLLYQGKVKMELLDDCHAFLV